MINTTNIGAINFLAFSFVAALFFIKNNPKETPITTLTLLLVVGSVVINMLATSSISNLEQRIDFVFFVYSSFVFTFLLTLLAKIRNKRAIHQNNKIFQISNSYIALTGFIFSIVAIYFIQVGFSSRESFGSPGWRQAIGSVATGYQYLIYNSGAVILAIYISKLQKLSISTVIYTAALAVLLLSYGGRFLAFSGIALGLSLRLNTSTRRHQIKHNSRSNSRLFIKFSALVAAAVIGAFVRYASSEGLDFSYALLRDTFQRQLSGNVYDFYISWGVADPTFTSKIIKEKIIVAILPFVFQNNYDLSLGAYLAEMAGRPFEGGHRISAIGEIFYIAGIPGVIALSMFYFFAASYADKLLNQGPNKKILGCCIGFTLLFSFFIDFSFIVTSIYMGLYLLAIRYGMKYLK